MSVVPNPIRRRTVPSEVEIEPEEVFEILSNQRRLYALHYLKLSDDTTVAFGDLVDHVTAWENGVSVEEVDQGDRKTIYTALRQSHLPKLEEAGIVEFDASTNQIELTETGVAVQLYLEYVPSDDISWSQYYLGLSVFAAMFVTAAWLGAPLISAVEWPVVFAVVIVMFVISSLAHSYQRRSHKVGKQGALSPIKDQ